MPAKNPQSEKVPNVRCTGYLHTYPEYEKRYGAKVRTIKKWVRVGRDADDICPLDDAGAMAAWWARNYKHRVPDAILRLARESGGQEDTSQDPIFNQPAAPMPELETGLQASVERLRQAEAVASHSYTEAVRLQKDEGEIQTKQRAWAQVSEQLRKAETSLRSLDGKYGQLYGPDEIKKELVEVHTTIYSGVKNLVRRMRPRLAKLEAVEQDAAWDEAVRNLFRGWEESGFCPTVEELPDCE